MADEFAPSTEVLRECFLFSRDASASLSHNSHDINLKRSQTSAINKSALGEHRGEEQSTPSTSITSSTQSLAIECGITPIPHNLPVPSMSPSNAHSIHTRELRSKDAQSSIEGQVCQSSVTYQRGEIVDAISLAQLSSSTASPSPSPAVVKYVTPITFNFIPTRASRISALSTSLSSSPLSF
jgi:hypothetical protein